MTVKRLSTTLFITLGAMLVALSASTIAMASPVVEVVMKSNGYHVKSGGYAGAMTSGFTLEVGRQTEVVLRNEDTTPHDFVSTMFKDLDVVIVGEATSIHHMGASGYRVGPGKTVKLRFTLRVGDEFQGGWDVFWCTIHGKANMRGEVIQADTRTGTGAF